MLKIVPKDVPKAGLMTGLGTEPWLKKRYLWILLDTNPEVSLEGPAVIEKGCRGRGGRLEASVRAWGELRTELVLGLSEELQLSEKMLCLSSCQCCNT